MMSNNPNLDLSINAYTKFGKILSIYSQDMTSHIVPLDVIFMMNLQMCLSFKTETTGRMSWSNESLTF